ncbi:MAG: tetratricopeptide repeat protein [Candidatus Obscuribacterales bacterium]|nr:tetratricopeptide repeat protein [Candidatus Obscuribacterales bacterium]
MSALSVALVGGTYTFMSFDGPTRLKSLFNQNTKVEPVKKTNSKKMLADAKNNSAAYVKILDQATNDLAAQISKSPNDPMLQNQLGLIYLSLGDYDTAEFYFKSAVSLCQEAISASTNNIEKSKTLGRMDEATQELMKASRMSVELSAAHSHLARLYDLRGDRQGVIAELDKLTSDGALFTASGPIRSKAGQNSKETQLLARAEANMKQNRIPQAIEDYKSVLKTNPKAVVAHEKLGLIYAMSADLPAAASEWEEAAKLEPKSSAVQNNLGLAYQKLGQKKEAEEAFRQALVLDPKSEEAALNLSELLAAGGELKPAMEILQEAAKNNPNSARAYNNIGTFLSLSGNYGEALSAYHKALKLAPNMASAHYGLGIALMHSHNYQPAIKALKQALVLDPRIPSAETKIEEAYRLAARN